MSPILKSTIAVAALSTIAVAALSIGSVAGSADVACRDEVGEKASAALVAHCLQASPATRPPCNDGNPCKLIIAEIKRGCRILEAPSLRDRGTAGESAAVPKFCASYPDEE